MICPNVVEKKEFKNEAVNKVTHIKSEQLTADTYYFKPGQVLDWHRHPEGDQIFFVHEGEGTFHVDAGKEESVALKPGVAVLAPKGVWHKIVAGKELIVSQSTRQPAGMEARPK
ncbi:MAG: cupin domain-containing protein [Syntrophales bacterium]|nr:cupin domain-containing protein [Syntrophales bacterium]